MWELIAFAAAVGAAWIPVLIHFWNAWRRRHNPLSLAICSLCGFAAWLSVSCYYFMTGSRLEVMWATEGVLALICVNFYASLWWSRRKFPDQRKEDRK